MKPKLECRGFLQELLEKHENIVHIETVQRRGHDTVITIRYRHPKEAE